VHARPHGRRQGHALDVGALGASRLGFLHRVGKGLDVLEQCLLGERHLADAGVQDARLLDAELDGAALGALTAPATSGVTVPTFGFGIRLRGPRILPRRPTSGIMSGVAMHAVEIDLAFLDLCDEVFGANDVGAGLAGFLGLGVLGEDGDANGLAGAVRQVHHAADHLVGMTRVDAQVHGDLDGLVELRLGALLAPS
jgi:hypothetical protein